jgi:16S rRNA processing protein RimM
LSKAAASPGEGLACMAEIVGVHGIKGFVKLKVFGDDPSRLSGDAPLCDSKGKPLFRLASVQKHGNVFLAQVEGVSDRTEAEKLRGTKLFLPRAVLPELRDEKTFYHADLIGMTARYPDGKIMGKVIAVVNFGAGDLLDIQPPKGASFYVPFTDAVVPKVDVGKKELIVDPPPGLID